MYVKTDEYSRNQNARGTSDFKYVKSVNRIQYTLVSLIFIKTIT